jgi:hypothetical protein
MKPTFALLLLLTGCSVVGADECTSASAHAPHFPRFGDPDQVDVRATAQSIDEMLLDVQQLSPEQRATATESMRILSVNCPFTRASMQLPIALHEAVGRIAPGQIDPLVQTDWMYLRHGLATHVALLDALSIDLPQPVPGDHLYIEGDAVLIIGRDALVAAAAPIQAAAPLIEQITPLVDEIDEPTMELIRLHSHLAGDAIGHPWTLGRQLGGWEKALRRIEPFVDDADTRAQIGAMIEVLDRYGEQGC